MATLTCKQRANPAALTVTVFALMAIGVVMVFSASASLRTNPLGDTLLAHSGVRQAIFVLPALAAMGLASRIPYRWWRLEPGRWHSPAVLLTVLTTVAVAATLIPGVGVERNYARRWLSVSGVSVQPSELAKLATVVFLAGYMTSGRSLRAFRSGLLPACAVIAVLMTLVGVEDFGTAALLGMVAGGMLLAGGARVTHLAALSVPAMVGAAGMIAIRPYRLERLVSFRDIWADASGSGCHAIQSLVAVATGGWFGAGLSNGIQKYGYLPEARSDFIFAIICEELGLIGAACVVGLFVVLIWQGRRTMLVCDDTHGRLLAFGLTWLIGLQAAMNVAVATVSVPTKGIALPFVSAGGSGLITLAAAMGLLISVARQAKEPS